MSFSKASLRAILSNVEGVTSDMLSEVCELHTTTTKELLSKENSKYEVLETKFNKLLNDSKVELDLHEVPEFKKLQEELETTKAEYDNFKNDIELKQKQTEQTTVKRKLLEEAGFKGSSLDLLVKDDFNVDINNSDNVAEYTKTMTEKYSDLLFKDKGADGLSVQNITATNDGGIYGRSAINNMSHEEINKAFESGNIDITKE